MKQITLPFGLSARQGLQALALALLALAGTAAAATAHGLLIKTEPIQDTIIAENPGQVRAWFSQELETHSSTIRVLDAQGQQVDNGDGGVDLYDPDHASLRVTLPESLPNGSYLVHWRAVSIEDGDQTQGEFIFSIGAASPLADRLLTKKAAAESEPGWPLGWIAAGAGLGLLAGAIARSWLG